MTGWQGTVLIAGAGRGPLLHLTRPISFWGGVDPASGRITDPDSDGHGRSIAGTVLAIDRTRGSSSSSAVMLELIHAGSAPAALLLAEPDAILAVGVLAARAMGWPHPPVLRLDTARLAGLADGTPLAVDGGAVVPAP
ncbi:MAG: DUF126 domain-containing protein [Rhodospirillaceae bacterium]|nr:DUF126 domain-containing protein [Rhodospirillaceae bacterium]